MTETDIIIIGAGLVGTSLIAALAEYGIRCCVLENHLPEIITAPADSRPIALSYSSQKILQTLGLWENIAADACPIHTVHVSDQGALGRLCFKSQELAVPALGYVSPYAALQKILYQQAAGQKNIEFISVQEILSIACDANGATVTAQTGHGQKTWASALLIAADGSHSTARRLLRVPVQIEDHQDRAWTALLTLHQSHENTAYERFTEHGALALLPLPQVNQYRLVWTHGSKTAAWLQQQSDTEIIAYLQQVFHNRLHFLTSFVRGESYPIKTVIATNPIRPGFVLLGNAAQTIYPLAAQGFNLALRDVATLSEILLEAKTARIPLGNIAILQKYHSWRRRDREKTIGLTGRMSELFGLQWPLMNRARGLGLLATDLLFPLKKRLAFHMMGLSGSVPKLARGVPLR